MFSKVIVLALAASPLVAAHGKVAVVTGDAGGNGTALAIMGGVVPGPGPNSKTEVDTTVFGKTNIQTDGLGKTTGQGKVNTAMISGVMAQSGSTLPQVNNEVSGVFHVVTSDGCGPVQAVLDPTGTGAFASGTMLSTTADVPGNNGQCPKSITKKSFVRSVLESAGVIAKRATNVNKDFPVAFAVPAGTTCTGTVGGQSNVCLVKIANNNKAGPFGGVVPVQMAGGAGNGSAPAAAAAGTGATAATKKQQREFVA